MLERYQVIILDLGFTLVHLLMITKAVQVVQLILYLIIITVLSLFTNVTHYRYFLYSSKLNITTVYT